MLIKSKESLKFRDPLDFIFCILSLILCFLLYSFFGSWHLGFLVIALAFWHLGSLSSQSLVLGKPKIVSSKTAP